MRVRIKMSGVPAAGLGLFLALTGCAGGRVYDNGINHVYLCAVRVVRADGYQVRQQEFRKRSGKMVAARSIPDPKKTPIRRGFFTRAAEVISNAIEHSKLEFWDQDLAASRIRTDRRVVAKFKARRGFLGLGGAKRTRVEFSIDSTDYGREDWVIKRERIKKGGREELYMALARCLEGARGPVLIASGEQPSEKAEAAPRARPAPEKPATAQILPGPEAEPAAQPAGPSPRAEPAGRKPVASPAAPAAAPAAKAPQSPEPGPAVQPAKKPIEVASAAPRAAAGPPPETSATPAAPVRLTPEELEEQLERGRKAYEAGKYEKTVQLLEIAIQTDPKNPEALGYLGAANYQLGRYDRAVEMYEQYLEIVPGDIRTEDFLAEIKKIRKEKGQAQ